MTTPAEYLNKSRVTAGRTSVTRNEVLRLMQSDLPGVIAEQNTREGLTAGRPTEFMYYASREVLTGLRFPAIICGISIAPMAGPPRVRWRTTTLAIAVISGPIEGREEVDDMWDIAELIDMIMLDKINGHCLPDGRAVWTQANFEGINQLPTEWSAYSGAINTYRLDQMGIDLWTVP